MWARALLKLSCAWASPHVGPYFSNALVLKLYLTLTSYLTPPRNRKKNNNNLITYKYSIDDLIIRVETK
jgi:hypothetical protein